MDSVIHQTMTLRTIRIVDSKYRLFMKQRKDLCFENVSSPIIVREANYVIAANRLCDFGSHPPSYVTVLTRTTHILFVRIIWLIIQCKPLL